MKEKFTTIDLFAILRELRERVLGMRVANVYDIDQKTYLIKLARPDEKVMLLLESGCRMHATEFDLPKNMQPSGFSMKLRKHLRTRRLTSLNQLGVDRVVDMQFGSNEAAYHLIVELYDRGNVILTDHALTILALLRTRTDADKDVRFAVRETFSRDTAKMEQPPPALEGVSEILKGAKVGDQLKHALNPHFVYGSALLSHCLIGAGFSDTVKVGTGFDLENDTPRLMSALEEAHGLFHRIRDEPGKGYIIQKKQAQPQVDTATKNGEGVDIFTNVEYHPLLFRQHEGVPHVEMESFNKAVDEFYSTRSSQKQDLKALQVQKSAVKKLDNIRKDHEKRINTLQKSQEEDMYKARLIELNVDLVERACIVIRSAIANAMDWSDIELLVKDAQAREDPVAMAIHTLKLKTNEITLLLRDPADEWGSDSDSDETDSPPAAAAATKKATKKATKVDIDLSMTAFSNARRYYGHKKQAAKKEKKTIDASKMALKSAEKKTKQTLKEASMVAKILKARKTHWFEKFYWFISSENYLVIGGRDQQQNELVVKKYLNDGDLYVHADLHGATSVIIKNPSGVPVPPKTLNEAGYMAVCYSSAWEARIITSAWWVYNHQVSKTAPTGEYLTTGSFMIRGKKNFLPPCQLILGFGFLFRVEESCIPNHLHERKPKASDDDELSVLSEVATELSVEEEVDELEEVDEAEKMLEQDKAGSDDHSTDDQDEFPDTSITVAHVAGETYELQRGTSVSSSIPDDPEQLEDTVAKEDKRHQHISAKQRRELRKQKQTAMQDDCTKSSQPSEKSSQKKSKQSQPIPPPPLQAKRGQKAKQKRIRDRYGDQDEEERELKLAILGSSGVPKEQKKGKKGGGKGKKKSFDVVQSSNPKQKYHQQRDKSEKNTPSSIVDQQHKQKAPLLVTVPETLDSQLLQTQSDLTVSDQMQESEMREEEEVVSELGATVGDDIEDKETESMEKEDDQSIHQHTERKKTDLLMTADESKLEDNHQLLKSPLNTEHEQEATAQVESDDEEKKALLVEENIQLLEETEREQLSVLDSFTGCPLPDDILLYAIPVCGPYSAMQSYKYKAKLVPGVNRRGKAAKAALFRFIQSKETSQREKDLLKSVKDNDLSRYIPGKVKLTLPQNYKAQHR